MITFDHGNDAGTGTRLAVDIVPSNREDKGSVTMSVFPQDGPRDEEGRPHFSSTCKASVEIGVVGIAHVLSVLDGEERALRGGRGVIVRTGGDSHVLHIDKVLEPYAGFSLHVQNFLAGGGKSGGRIMLSLTEGAALSYALKAAMGAVAFGCSQSQSNSRRTRTKSKSKTKSKENTK